MTQRLLPLTELSDAEFCAALRNGCAALTLTQRATLAAINAQAPDKDTAERATAALLRPKAQRTA